MYIYIHICVHTYIYIYNTYIYIYIYRVTPAALPATPPMRSLNILSRLVSASMTAPCSVRRLIYMHMYIYICVCMCVYVCVYRER